MLRMILYFHLYARWTQEISFQTTEGVFHKWWKFINVYMKRRLTSSTISYKSTAKKTREIIFIDPIPLFIIYHETTFNCELYRLPLFKVFFLPIQLWILCNWISLLIVACFLPAVYSHFIAFLDLKPGFLINKNNNCRSLRHDL